VGLEEAFRYIFPDLGTRIFWILPDFLGAEQLSIPLNLLMAKSFRFSQQALCNKVFSHILLITHNQAAIPHRHPHTFKDASDSLARLLDTFVAPSHA
jgi:hypothetical protein